MPAGDPAGYLPNVRKARRYRVRSQRMQSIKPNVRLTPAPSKVVSGSRPENMPQQGPPARPRRLFKPRRRV